MQTVLKRVFSSDPECEVVGAVARPEDVLEQISQLRPDVITLDLHLPGRTGVEVLRQYFPQFPIPTVVVSALSLQEGTLVLDALAEGAIDYIQKLTAAEISSRTIEIVEKIKTASRARVVAREAGVSVAPASSRPKPKPLSGAPSSSTPGLILIGSSTGGTEALKQILTELPREMPPIVIVQHIPAVFSKAFADRLNTLCALDVKEAAEGDVAKSGTVLIAPGGFHLKLQWRSQDLSWGVVIDQTEPVNRHRPSVDVLFDSVAKRDPWEQIGPLMGVVLTGMGADGADGLRRLRDLGAHTIAQDEATSVVFGMPRVAIEKGGACEVLPLGQIAQRLKEVSVRGSFGRQKKSAVS